MNPIPIHLRTDRRKRFVHYKGRADVPPVLTWWVGDRYALLELHDTTKGPVYRERKPAKAEKEHTS